MRKLTINIPRDKVDYFMEVLEKGVEGTKNKHKQFVKSQIGRMYSFKYEYDSMIRMHKKYTKIFLDGEVVMLNRIQDLDVVDAYTIKREEDIARIYYNDRLIYECKMEELLNDGYVCKLFIKGELKKVKLKLVEMEEEKY